MRRLKNQLLGWMQIIRQTPMHPQWLLPDSRDILEMIHSTNVGLVLDIGCADRWIENHLPQHCSYIGLDYLATGKTLYGSKPDIFADAAHLPVMEGSIDSVLLLDVLEHLPEPDKALAEANRVLKIGGSLVVSVPFLYPVHDAPYDFQRYTMFGMRQAIKRGGFDLVRIMSYSRSVEVVGLFVSLWAAGTVITCWKEKKFALVLAPILIAIIPFINVSAWLAANVFPDWKAISGGVNVLARKRQ